MNIDGLCNSKNDQQLTTLHLPNAQLWEIMSQLRVYQHTQCITNLPEPISLIPENATYENKVEFQDLCHVFYIQCYILSQNVLRLH